MSADVVVTLVVGLFGVALGGVINWRVTAAYRRCAEDYARELKARDAIDPIRKTLEAIRDDNTGHDHLVVLRDGRLLAVSRVHEVTDFASRIEYRFRVAEIEDPDLRNHSRPQFESGMGAIRHDAILLVTATRSWSQAKD